MPYVPKPLEFQISGVFRECNAHGRSSFSARKLEAAKTFVLPACLAIFLIGLTGVYDPTKLLNIC